MIGDHRSPVPSCIQPSVLSNRPTDQPLTDYAAITKVDRWSGMVVQQQHLGSVRRHRKTGESGVNRLSSPSDLPRAQQLTSQINHQTIQLSKHSLQIQLASVQSFCNDSCSIAACVGYSPSICRTLSPHSLSPSNQPKPTKAVNG